MLSTLLDHAFFSLQHDENSRRLIYGPFLVGRNHDAKTSRLVFLTWRVMRRKERNDIAKLQMQKLNNCTKYPLHAWTTMNSKKEELEIGWRFVKSLLSIRLEMLSCGTNWKTWHSLVCVQVGTSCHKMNQSWWQTFGSSHSLHSSHEWSQTTLPCGWYGTSLSILPRLRLCCGVSRFFGRWSSHGRNHGSRSLGIVEVVHSSPSSPLRGDSWRDETQTKHANTKTKKHVNRDDVEIFNVDHVNTNAKPSHVGAFA